MLNKRPGTIKISGCIVHKAVMVYIHGILTPNAYMMTVQAYIRTAANESIFMDVLNVTVTHFRILTNEPIRRPIQVHKSGDNTKKFRISTNVV